MVKKELGQRNFGLDPLESRLNRDMEEEGIVARDCLSPEPRCPLRCLGSGLSSGLCISAAGGACDMEEAAEA